MQDRQDPTVIQHAVILPIRTDGRAWVNAEPALSDMLADPITQLLMRRDGVQEAEIRRLAARLRDRLQAHGPGSATGSTTGNGPALAVLGGQPGLPGWRAANDFADSRPL